MASLAPKTPFDVRRNAGSSLSAVEQTVFDLLKERASANETISRADIVEAIGSRNWLGGTAAGILNRLEREKGVIRRTFYQRGLQVCIVETGECTAPPRCTAVHHTQRPKNNVPTPAIQAIRQRSTTAAGMIEMIAKQTGMAIQDVLAELVQEALDARRLAHDC